MFIQFLSLIRNPVIFTPRHPPYLHFVSSGTNSVAGSFGCSMFCARSCSSLPILRKLFVSLRVASFLVISSSSSGVISSRSALI